MLNGIVNIQFLCGRAEEEIVPLIMRLREERRQTADLVIVDPPRAGCRPELLEAILDAAPEKIIYVSCDPGTMARDLTYLTADQYEIRRIRPVDQFCHSVHVEAVCLLSNTQSKKKESYITLDVEMADYYRIKNEGKNSTT